MFRKLLKHELRATRGLLGALSIAAASIGVLGGIVLRLLLMLPGNNTSENPMPGLAAAGLSTALGFMAMALMAYGIAVQIYLYWRFYKHKFTDQGYLTFTLPVSCGEIWFSAYAGILIWTGISAAVIVLSIFATVLIGAGEYILSPEVQKVFWEAWELFSFSEEASATAWISVAVSLISVITAPALTMGCITLGAVLAKKHKILTAFALYYGINAALSFIQSVMTVFLGLSTFTNPLLFYNISLVLSCALQVLLAAGGSWLCIWLTENKLNLP